MNNKRAGKHGIRIIAVVISALILGLSACRDWQQLPEPSAASDSSFVFLGDMHYDRPEHHDMNWVAGSHPGDVVQIENYCRVTKENTPALMASVAAISADQPRPLSCIVQAGDFTEGLCGSYDLQTLQFRQAISFVSGYSDPVPFLITKGNHDITGPGAPKAYDDVVLPWLSRQLKQDITSASYAVAFGRDRFLFFDSYNPDLDWIEKTLDDTNARYTFVVTHMPVVPFEARATWHLFAAENQQPQRERLLSLLGRHKAIVLCGHLHGFSILRRDTPAGSFLQIAMNSVISDQARAPENHLSGVENYSSDLVNLEPSFSPGSLEVRKQILENEKPMIRQFEYARTAGFICIRCTHEKLLLDLYPGASSAQWKSFQLSAD